MSYIPADPDPPTADPPDQRRPVFVRCDGCRMYDDCLTMRVSGWTGLWWLCPQCRKADGVRRPLT